MSDTGWKLVPFASIKRPPSRLGPHTSPLLKEKRYSLCGAVVPNLAQPIDVHRACAGAAFPSCNDPVYTGQVYATDWPYERLNR